MSIIFTPTNQIRLTNVTVVRLKKMGKRFEIACYKNKVIAWRNQVETDINEVLQTHSVFSNVSKGEFAKKEDILKAFGTNDLTTVCKQILEKGEFQISEKERQSNLDQVFKEIVSEVSDKCLNPETLRPYPVSMIERAIKDIPFSVKATKTPKQQALQVIKMLQEKMPIVRANMRIRIKLEGKNSKKLRNRINKITPILIEKEEKIDDTIDLIITLDPGQFRELETLFDAEARGTPIEVLQFEQKSELKDVS